MPWHVDDQNPECPGGWAVVKDADNTVAGCHETQAEAEAQVQALYAQEPDAVGPAAASLDMSGTPWSGPLVVENAWSGDGRQFAAGALTWADLPLPLKWQPAEAPGHDGSVIVGRIDSITRQGDQLIGNGVMDDAGQYGAEAVRLMRLKMLRGVSIKADDMDETDIEYIYGDDEVQDFHLPGRHNQKDHGGGASKGQRDYDRARSAEKRRKVAAAEDAPTEPVEDVPAVPLMPLDQPTKMLVHAGRIRSATLVAEAAFAECVLTLAGPMTAAAYTISIPEVWPESWFDEPKELPPFGALHITPEGRVFGLLGPSNVAHRAFRASGRQVTIPRGIDYSEFQNKPCLVAGADGQIYKINAGSITFDCGHPSPQDPRRADSMWAMQHYDNTCSIAARVRVGENSSGTWVAGGLLHGITPDAVERMMASALSGDWQGGRLNAALLVPVEGFPTAVSASVRVKDDALIASTVPVRFMAEPAAPDLRPVLERMARQIGRDRASRFAALAQRRGRG